MRRMRNFKLNWKYALGEITLIFVGISLAMAFQSWADQRKEDQETNDILEEIRVDLQEDTLRMSRLIIERKLDLEATQRMKAVIQAKTSFNDQIRTDLGRILLYRKFYFRTDGFDHMEESNFKSIRTTRLKKDLINYYQESVGQVLDNIGEDQYTFQRVLLPYVRNNFTDWSFGEYGMPYNYDDMKEDHFLLTSITIDAENCASTIEEMTKANSLAKSLLSQIDLELN